MTNEAIFHFSLSITWYLELLFSFPWPKVVRKLVTIPSTKKKVSYNFIFIMFLRIFIHFCRKSCDHPLFLRNFSCLFLILPQFFLHIVDFFLNFFFVLLCDSSCLSKLNLILNPFSTFIQVKDRILFLLLLHWMD